MMRHNIRRLCGIVLLTFACACTTAGESESVSVGTVDTLESGLVAVTNPATGIWNGETSWRVVEELRIGTLEGNGPDLFGQITDVAVDPASRMYASVVSPKYGSYRGRPNSSTISATPH